MSAGRASFGPLPDGRPVERLRIADGALTAWIGRHGYDHNVCLADTAPGADAPLRPAAGLSSPPSGLRMQIETAQPGLQACDGARFDGLPGLAGRVYGPFAGITLETQAWPDSPNRPDVPDAILRPGATCRNRMRHVFGRG